MAWGFVENRLRICQGSVAGLLAVRYGSVGGQSKSSMEVNLRARWWSVEGLLDIHLGLLSVLFLEGVHWLVHLSIFGVSCGWSIGRQFGSGIRGYVSSILELIPIGDPHWNFFFENWDLNAPICVILLRL